MCIKTKSVIDGLPVRCVGSWAYEKIYYLTQYFGIFAIGMKNKWSNKLNYIEICSGPGRCVQRENGEEIDGTPLSIINHDAFKHISKAVFIDKNDTIINALNRRIVAAGKQRGATAKRGDYTDICSILNVIEELGDNCLNLVLIDPTDCSFPFDTLRAISNMLGNVDFIVNIAIGTDVNRNICSAILAPGYTDAKEKYIRFLGDKSYFSDRDILKYAEKENFGVLRRKFMEKYENNLKKIGFRYSASEPVQHYYELLFFSKNRRGLNFWKKAQSIKPHGQRKLFS